MKGRVTERQRQREREREREREKEVFHPLVHFPSGCNGRSCADPKPGARSFFQVSYKGCSKSLYLRAGTVAQPVKALA